MATLVLPKMPPAANKPGVLSFKAVMPPAFASDTERQRFQKGALALGARVMDERGWGVGYSVGLSARDALDTNLVWVVPRGKPLCTIVSADLIGVDLKGEIRVSSKDGRGLDPEWLPLHLAVYNARSDVNGITSGHTPHARAFSVKGETLKMLWQDSCTFYNCVPVCPFQTAANAATNPQGIADVLGEKGIGMILQNRGVLSCAGTIEGAVGGYVRIEGLVGNQLLVEAAIKGRGGDVVPIGEEEILFSQKNTSGEYSQWFQAQPYFARVVERHGSALEI
ncbi:uncharacterized protein EHS24_005290 [Apiotrichum porosum]|uniref:Class II aldolase/adducin N-terminal domain-containing protein n=1 Tax=Apiotrichum porosum TaxID=105984 RepID=A0A427XDC1_9TREE|nr:uncharacterized protein EHS24_005290 [Apiotrichum porosum]RSH76714.1 hypothetical protein EHS24_005290 [Apiotrichum porosum]